MKTKEIKALPDVFYFRFKTGDTLYRARKDGKQYRVTWDDGYTTYTCKEFHKKLASGYFIPVDPA